MAAKAAPKTTPETSVVDGEDKARAERAAAAQKDIAAAPAPVTEEQSELHSPVPTEDTPTNGVEQIQAQYDEINAKGYVGETPDDSPNHAYTVPSHGGTE